MNRPDKSTEDVIQGMLAEWKRSMLTFWTLSLVSIQPMYGLEIKQAIENSTQGRMLLGPSTIYQLLRRLEQRGLVESYWERTAHGPPRAYYRTTETGREVLRRYLTEVFLPGSPIAAALGQLMGQLFRQFPEIFPNNPPEGGAG
jgi:DNA-binding PadR family transcriptional regulator